MGGERPGSRRRAMCDSAARATALMRPPVGEGARRVEENGGTRVCRQQSHLSGRAAAWVGAVAGSAQSWVAALCMCSHPAMNSTTVAAADFHVKLGQASSFPQVGPRLLQARMPMSARVLLLTYAASSLTRYVNPRAASRSASSPARPRGCDGTCMFHQPSNITRYARSTRVCGHSVTNLPHQALLTTPSRV